MMEIPAVLIEICDAALIDYAQGWISRILGRAAFRSGIQIFLLEVHGRRAQMMVVTIGALRPL
jgi:hypothetical protein